MKCLEISVAAFLGQSVKEVRPPAACAEKRLVGRTSRSRLLEAVVVKHVPSMFTGISSPSPGASAMRCGARQALRRFREPPCAHRRPSACGASGWPTRRAAMRVGTARPRCARYALQPDNVARVVQTSRSLGLCALRQ